MLVTSRLECAPKVPALTGLVLACYLWLSSAQMSRGSGCLHTTVVEPWGVEARTKALRIAFVPRRMRAGQMNPDTVGWYISYLVAAQGRKPCSSWGTALVVPVGRSLCHMKAAANFTHRRLSAKLIAASAGLSNRS